MLKKIITTQTKSLTWAASTAVSESLLTDGLITRMILDVRVTPSATLAAASFADSLSRVIESLKVEGGGGRSYVGLSGAEQMGRLLHLANMRDGFGPGHGLLPIVAPFTTFTSQIFVLHFGSRIRDQYGRDNPFDLTAFIPGKQETGNLKIEWGTGPATDVVDDTVDISSAIMKVTLCMVLGSESELRAEMARQGVRQAMIPSSSTTKIVHSGNQSNLGEEKNIPTKNYLRRIWILSQDAVAQATTNGPFRALDEIDRIGIKVPGINEKVIDADFTALNFAGAPGGDFMEQDDTVMDGGIAAPHGFVILDMRPFEDPDYGIDLRGRAAGDLSLGLTIQNYASGDDTIVVYDQLVPWHDALIP